MDKSVFRNILLDYEKKRDKAERSLEKRRKHLYTQIPQIEEIDDEINKTGLEMMRLVLKNPSDKDLLANQTKNKINELNKKRQDLFEFYGVPKEYLDIKYECNVCKDRGFLEDGRKCNCLKQQLINESYKMSNLSRILENQKPYDDSIFSDEIDPSAGVSPRQNMQNILAICEDFILNFERDNEQNLIFYGETGLGKTFMSSYIAKRVLDRGHTVIYQTAFKMFDIIKDYQFKTENSNITKEDYENLFNCDLLIIDDLGTELTNTFTVSELFIILNTRLINGKKTIISTNFDIYQIAEVYTQRIFSRIFDKFEAVEFIGKDVRWDISIQK